MPSPRLQSLGRTALVEAKNLLTWPKLGTKILLPKYRYMFSPEQLWALCEAAEHCAPLGGAFAEIGVFDGSTTAYINRHLREQGFAPKYYCLDTFSGFTPEDVAVERERGQTDDYARHFYLNSKQCFERTMRQNGVDEAVVIQADASTFDYSSLEPLAFALVDVDLYRPVQVALAACWERLLPGGMIVVDDCTKDIDAFEGALYAYTEFCEAHGFPVDIRHGKLGYLSKPPTD